MTDSYAFIYFDSRRKSLSFCDICSFEESVLKKMDPQNFASKGLLVTNDHQIKHSSLSCLQCCTPSAAGLFGEAQMNIRSRQLLW